MRSARRQIALKKITRLYADFGQTLEQRYKLFDIVVYAAELNGLALHRKAAVYKVVEHAVRFGGKLRRKFRAVIDMRNNPQRFKTFKQRF